MDNQKLIDSAIAMAANFNPEIGNVLKSIPIIVTSAVPRTSVARYNYLENCIQVGPEVVSVETLAAVLLHEGTHALDNANGKLSIDPRRDPISAQVDDEVRAFSEDARFWTTLYPNGKHPPLNEAETSENIWQEAYQRSLLRLNVEESYFPMESQLHRMLGIPLDAVPKLGRGIYRS